MSPYRIRRYTLVVYLSSRWACLHALLPGSWSDCLEWCHRWLLQNPYPMMVQWWAETNSETILLKNCYLSGDLLCLEIFIIQVNIQSCPFVLWCVLLQRRCMMIHFRWSRQNALDTLTALTDVRLTLDQLALLFEKAWSIMDDCDIQDVPLYIYQLLKLSSLVYQIILHMIF